MKTARSDTELIAELMQAPIGTRRLILRPPVADDIAAVSRMVNDKVIARNTGLIRYPYSPRSAWQWLAGAGRVEGGRFHLPYLLTLRSNPRLFAGAVGFSMREGGVPTIGYWLARPYRGKGFASEAARALISLLFTKCDVPAVAASARTVNTASRRVLEAAGMRRIGFGKIKSVQLGRYVPVVLYRIERKSWENLRTRASG
jgi:RimJ/RimL family protein N-acetyltransferase